MSTVRDLSKPLAEKTLTRFTIPARLSCRLRVVFLIVLASEMKMTDLVISTVHLMDLALVVKTLASLSHKIIVAALKLFVLFILSKPSFISSLPSRQATTDT
jgi:hypothetical protein